MSRFYYEQLFVRAYLNLERVCLETFGSSLFPHAEDTNKCGKWLGYAIFAVVFLLEMVYYYIHFKYVPSENDDEENGNNEDGHHGHEQELGPLLLIQLVDLVVIFVLLTFPLAGPMHRALGYSGEYLDPLVLHTRLDDVLKDPGTARSVQLSSVCVILYTIGEAIFFLPRMTYESNWWTVIYLISILYDIITFYAAMCVIMLTMQVAIVRLHKIEDSVLDVLAHTNSLVSNNHPTYDTMNNGGNTMENNNEHQGIHSEMVTATTPFDLNESENNQQNSDDLNALALQWAHEYRCIRQDMHHVSVYFGFRMLLGLLLFVLDTTTLMSNIWELLEEDLSVLDKLSLLMAFLANSTMIVSALYSTAFLVTQCSHHIGPQLAILAAAQPHDAGHRIDQVATLFLHAPIRLHVGNFELSPEYSNAIALWFLGLFLLVFGLKMPGGE